MLTAVLLPKCPERPVGERELESMVQAADSNTLKKLSPVMWFFSWASCTAWPSCLSVFHRFFQLYDLSAHEPCTNPELLSPRQ